MAINLSFQKKKLVLNKCSLLMVIVFSAFSCSSLKNVEDNGFMQYDSLTCKMVYTFVEKMPQYKGGNIAFMNEFGRKFHYEFEKHEDIQTKLRVQFVINKKGFLIGARIYNKKFEEFTNFEKEALRIISSLQNWEFGKHNNKNVDVIITMVIDVDLLYSNK
ncbi:hypothetical protein [Bacteroides cellulosilyticus]|uniref:hypothetical protein n=1 Tax=Bacteroides cellulosilyticus TaxID=246787 RepID=UPI00101D8B24|nr:hypothetical protein [Bacteroides cellulosilyticus]